MILYYIGNTMMMVGGLTLITVGCFMITHPHVNFDVNDNKTFTTVLYLLGGIFILLLSLL